MATTFDGKFSAFDQNYGDVLWETELNAAGFATPRTPEAADRSSWSPPEAAMVTRPPAMHLSGSHCTDDGAAATSKPVCSPTILSEPFSLR